MLVDEENLEFMFPLRNECSRNYDEMRKVREGLVFVEIRKLIYEQRINKGEYSRHATYR